jgi:hypothetical protein
MMIVGGQMKEGVEAVEVRPEEMVVEMDHEAAAETDREEEVETDREEEVETDPEEAVAEAKVIAKREAEVAEAGLTTTTEAEVKDAKCLDAEIDVTTAGPETDVDVTTCKKNPTLYKLDVVGVEEEMAVVARVDTLTETSACEWMSQQATTNHTAIKMIPTDMVVTTKAMIKATIRATILSRLHLDFFYCVD